MVRSAFFYLSRFSEFADALALGPCSGCGGGAWLVGILVATVILGGHEYVLHVPHIDFMPLLLLLH